VYKFTVDTQTPRVKDIREVLDEVEKLAQAARAGHTGDLTIKDLRRLFDQESSRLNQAIFNDQPQQIRESTLRSVIPLLEILARS
jgi:hypothetical protein